MLNKIAFNVAMAGLLASLSGTASALEDQWYVGIGGGMSLLQPEPTMDTMADVDDDNGQAAVIFFGKDFDNRSSGQFQLYSLGEAAYGDDQGKATYTAGDASLLYRFFDSRDRRPRGTIFGTSIYGRFGFGFMQRDSDLPLESDSPVYFGAGAGIETYLSYNLAMRLEGLYHDEDVATATLSLVSRFGGRRRAPSALPPVASRPTATSTPTLPDAVADTDDKVITSIAVQENAVAVPTDLPETYEIPPAGLPSVDPQTGQAENATAIANENGDAIDLPSAMVANDTETSELPAVELLGDPDAADLPQVELLDESDAGELPPVAQADTDNTDDFVDLESAASEEAGFIPEVEVVGDTTEVLSESLVQTLPPTDTDADGVMDDQDQCADSSPGYPVNSRGCPVFAGLLPELTFNDRTADLSSGSYVVLDNLAQQLKDYPETYIELVAHTDNSGTAEQQSELTRQRLRSIGVYLVRHGISQERLLLRSYGGTRPAFDNSTADGRRRNNRIEVFENP